MHSRTDVISLTDKNPSSGTASNRLEVRIDKFTNHDDPLTPGLFSGRKHTRAERTDRGKGK